MANRGPFVMPAVAVVVAIGLLVLTGSGGKSGSIDFVRFDGGAVVQVLIAPALLIYALIAAVVATRRSKTAKPAMARRVLVHAAAIVLAVAVVIALIFAVSFLDDAAQSIHEAKIDAKQRRLRGAVTLEKFQPSEAQVVASVSTRAGATFSVMAGACDSVGNINLRDQRGDQGPRTLELTDGGRADLVLPMRRESPGALEGWWFEIDAMYEGSPLMQQIYHSGSCDRGAVSTHATLYLPLP